MPKVGQLAVGGCGNCALLVVHCIFGEKSPAPAGIPYADLNGEDHRQKNRQDAG
jgi:hypothetical protein